MDDNLIKEQLVRGAVSGLYQSAAKLANDSEVLRHESGLCDICDELAKRISEIAFPLRGQNKRQEDTNS